MWTQVHPRGNAVFLWDWLLYSQAWDQQHLICHLYVRPPLQYPTLHHLLLLQPPALHRASGRNTSVNAVLTIRFWYIVYPCRKKNLVLLSPPFKEHHGVASDVRDLVVQGHFRRAAHCQQLRHRSSGQKGNLPAYCVILMSLLIIWENTKTVYELFLLLKTWLKSGFWSSNYKKMSKILWLCNTFQSFYNNSNEFVLFCSPALL